MHMSASSAHLSLIGGAHAPAMNHHTLKPKRAAAVVGLAAFIAVGAGCGGSANISTAPADAVPAAATMSAGSSPLGLQQQFENVVKAVSPSVVQVQTSHGLGSGVVYDSQGDIVTNAHVVDNATSFLVTLPDGDRHPAKLVGVDRANDIAVVRLAGARPAPAVFGDSSSVQSGDLALALGNPLGLTSSVTSGIVSGERRAVSEGNGVTLPLVIQTSAEINPGNSGGALVDIAGRVIGIPTLAALDPELGDSAAPGIGFAIPSNTASSIANRLIEGAS
jgi:S1-C subfamily serine protease